MNAAEAISHIKMQTGDAKKFQIRQRGYVDWKFGELAEYMGYSAALDYVTLMRSKWYDYETKYQGQCLLDTTYTDFLNAHSSASDGQDGQGAAKIQ